MSQIDSGLVSWIGIIVQLVGAMLLALLFFVLRRDASRRAYFGVWTQGWMTLVVAMSALVIRFDLVPGIAFHIAANGWTERVLYAVYLAAKLLFSALLAGGALAYARSLRLARYYAVTLGVSALAALGAAMASLNLEEIVVLQSPVAVAGYLCAAWLLLHLPRSRRSLGSRVTGIVNLVGAALWIAYGFCFAASAWTSLSALQWMPREWIRFNSYIDLLLQMLLGFGMVVMLMDDSRREAQDARAELEVAHDQLRRTALYDPLTGALNRQAFEEGVGLDAIRASYGTVIVLDMDNLKTVNDTYGHAAGDMLLHQLVVVLRASLRPSDRLYRWGGDEFLLVLPGSHGVEVCERIQQSVEGSLPVHILGAPAGLKALVSMGAADYTSGESLQAAIARADAEMYRNKSERKALAGRMTRAAV